MHQLRKSIIIITLSLLYLNSWSQGCSDAGFCTIESFKPGDLNIRANYQNQLRVGMSHGKADHGISVISSHLEYRRSLNEKIRINSKFTALYQSGNGISVFGLSDILLNANYSVTDQMNFTLGAKVPLNNANRKYEGLPLPMDYQSSLGTFDLIAGMGYNFNKLQIILALQQPLTQNKNEFFAEQYPDDSDLRKIQSTNNYVRRGDLMARVSYPFNLSQNLQINLSLLPIYHLSNDQYTNMEGDKMEISGSRGLTFNSNIFADFYINEKSSIQLNFGMPFITRESRPDGLTRHYLLTLEYGIHF